MLTVLYVAILILMIWIFVWALSKDPAKFFGWILHLTALIGGFSSAAVLWLTESNYIIPVVLIYGGAMAYLYIPKP